MQHNKLKNVYIDSHTFIYIQKKKRKTISFIFQILEKTQVSKSKGKERICGKNNIWGRRTKRGKEQEKYLMTNHIKQKRRKQKESLIKLGWWCWGWKQGDQEQGKPRVGWHQGHWRGEEQCSWTSWGKDHTYPVLLEEVVSPTVCLGTSSEELSPLELHCKALAISPSLMPPLLMEYSRYSWIWRQNRGEQKEPSPSLMPCIDPFLGHLSVPLLMTVTMTIPVCGDSVAMKLGLEWVN